MITCRVDAYLCMQELVLDCIANRPVRPAGG
jgi:hypothetical protein